MIFQFYLPAAFVTVCFRMQLVQLLSAKSFLVPLAQSYGRFVGACGAFLMPVGSSPTLFLAALDPRAHSSDSAIISRRCSK